MPRIDCTEPNGREVITLASGTTTAHLVMLRENGQCPWCGETATLEDFTYPSYPQPDCPYLGD